MTIDKYLARMKSVLDNLPNATENVINTNSGQIADLNREQQLYFKGEDAKGKKLIKYKPFTIKVKMLKRQPFDRTTLNDTGDFFNKFIVKYNKSSYTITIYSTDKKTLSLIQKYGQDIFGLNKDNARYMDESIIKQHLDKWILSKL